MSGPFETERQAREAPAVRTVYAEFDRHPGAGQMIAPNTSMITQACDAAGVELGAYDRRIIEWLAGWEPATCAVVAGLITRARRALSAEQRDLLGGMLADAVTYRQPSGDCADCDSHPASLCWDHSADLDRVEVYLKLASQLAARADR